MSFLPALASLTLLALHSLSIAVLIYTLYLVCQAMRTCVRVSQEDEEKNSYKMIIMRDLQRRR